MKRELRGATAVITGASSGIGRATALAFARAGANVVLAARREDALRELAAECETHGVRAIAVPADTSDEPAVERVAEVADFEFGGIDVWVNDAAVTVLARFEDTPLEDFRRVFDTNVFGYVHGARAALRRFRARGRGVLINVASVDAVASQPYMSAYVASKHAIHGLDKVLRQELLLDGARDIHVCTVLPATIDTPLFQHAANYTGRAAKAMPPVYPAAQVADTIVRLAVKPEREVLVGRSARQMAEMYRRSLAAGEKVMARMTDASQLHRRRAAPPTRGNLYEPMADGDVSGGWRSPGRRFIRAVATLGAAALPASVGWMLLRPRIRQLIG